MVLKKLVKNYKSYEAKTLSKRADKKRKLKAYKALKPKKIVKVKAKRKFSEAGFTKAIGNPYGVKFSKSKKILKKIKKDR